MHVLACDPRTLHRLHHAAAAAAAADTHVSVRDTPVRGTKRFSVLCSKLEAPNYILDQGTFTVLVKVVYIYIYIPTFSSFYPE